MEEIKSNPQTPAKEENIRLILDFLHRVMMHHAMWFAEVQHQLGNEKAYEIIESAWERSMSIQLSRIAKTLGFEIKDGLLNLCLTCPKIC